MRNLGIREFIAAEIVFSAAMLLSSESNEPQRAM